ncbi:MAG: 4-hydroxy-3-methylbut-2-en-1-yl diphosphate synthase, partial [Methylophilaceae bacterium]|nr:4-hydroxy-3-methylbut-2-en-1-yl diphosphate synthase [Methylophilaceae bacterium]
MVGQVAVGGGLYGTVPAPVVVQSMTNTDTADAKSTIAQVYALWQ